MGWKWNLWIAVCVYCVQWTQPCFGHNQSYPCSMFPRVIVVKFTRSCERVACNIPSAPLLSAWKKVRHMGYENQLNSFIACPGSVQSIVFNLAINALVYRLPPIFLPTTISPSAIKAYKCVQHIRDFPPDTWTDDCFCEITISTQFNVIDSDVSCGVPAANWTTMHV